MDTHDAAPLSYYQRHKEARLRYQKQWCAQNHAKRLAGKKRYREAHKEQIAARMKAYWSVHRKPLTEKQKEEKKERTRRYYLANKERLNKEGWLRYRPAHLKRKYNLTMEDFLALLKKQRFRCAICATDTNRLAEKSINMAIDHCHTTGTVRGLLCTRCNAALGLFGDNLALLGRAHRYLKKFSTSS